MVLIEGPGQGLPTEQSDGEIARGLINAHRHHQHQHPQQPVQPATTEQRQRRAIAHQHTAPDRKRRRQQIEPDREAEVEQVEGVAVQAHHQGQQTGPGRRDQRAEHRRGRRHRIERARSQQPAEERRKTVLKQQGIDQIPARPALTGLANRFTDQGPVIHIPGGRADFLPVNRQKQPQKHQGPAAGFADRPARQPGRGGLRR